MRKTNTMNILKFAGMAVVGAAMMLGLVLAPKKIVKAERPDVPEGYHNEFCYFVEDGNTIEIDSIVYKTGTLYLDSEIEAPSDIAVPSIKLPTGLISAQISGVIAENGAVLPENCSKLFSYLKECKSIDLKAADASKVTTMHEMFSYDTKLETVDLSGLNAARLEDTVFMFYNCATLKNINLTGFSAKQLKDMEGMFCDCEQLESVDLSSINSTQIRSMISLFSGCQNLKSVNISNFDTSDCIDFYGMFENCSSLTALEFGENWNTEKVYDFSKMFDGCSSLHTIYVKKNWSFESLEEDDDSKDMFKGTTSLVGGAGTTYDANHTTHSYAKIDGGTADPGYFTCPTVLGELDASSDTFTLRMYIPVDTSQQLLGYEFSFDGSSYNPEYFDYTPYIRTIGTQDYFTLEMDYAAKEIADSKKLVVKQNNVEIINTSVSVAKYLKTLLETPSHSKYHSIAGTMLRYGAAAQIYFNYNYDDDDTKLANYGIDSSYSIDSLNNVTVPSRTFDATAINSALSTANTGFVYGGINIIHGQDKTKDNSSDTGLMLAFKLEDGGDTSDADTTALENLLNSAKDNSVGEIELTDDNNKKYKIAKIYVPIKQLGKPLFKIGGTELSIIQYMNLACNNTNSTNTENSQKLCKALYGYYEAVNNYTGN